MSGQPGGLHIVVDAAGRHQLCMRSYLNHDAIAAQQQNANNVSPAQCDFQSISNHAIYEPNAR